MIAPPWLETESRSSRHALLDRDQLPHALLIHGSVRRGTTFALAFLTRRAFIARMAALTEFRIRCSSTVAIDIDDECVAGPSRICGYFNPRKIKTSPDKYRKNIAVEQVRELIGFPVDDESSGWCERWRRYRSCAQAMNTRYRQLPAKDTGRTGDRKQLPDPRGRIGVRITGHNRQSLSSDSAWPQPDAAGLPSTGCNGIGSRRSTGTGALELSAGAPLAALELATNRISTETCRTSLRHDLCRA